MPTVERFMKKARREAGVPEPSKARIDPKDVEL
jgi:hypothetical protein